MHHGWGSAHRPGLSVRCQHHRLYLREEPWELSRAMHWYPRDYVESACAKRVDMSAQRARKRFQGSSRLMGQARPSSSPERGASLATMLYHGSFEVRDSVWCSSGSNVALVRHGPGRRLPRLRGARCACPTELHSGTQSGSLVEGSEQPAATLRVRITEEGRIRGRCPSWIRRGARGTGGSASTCAEVSPRAGAEQLDCAA
jgi:hypothetical protein